MIQITNSKDLSNGIGFMIPGQGYQIKIFENDILQY